MCVCVFDLPPLSTGCGNGVQTLGASYRKHLFPLPNVNGTHTHTFLKRLVSLGLLEIGSALTVGN